MLETIWANFVAGSADALNTVADATGISRADAPAALLAGGLFWATVAVGIAAVVVVRRRQRS